MRLQETLSLNVYCVEVRSLYKTKHVSTISMECLERSHGDRKEATLSHTWRIIHQWLHTLEDCQTISKNEALMITHIREWNPRCLKKEHTTIAHLKKTHGRLKGKERSHGLLLKPYDCTYGILEG